MTDDEWNAVKNSFEWYVARFAESTGILSAPLQLKKEHSERVAAEARALSGALGWSDEERRLAEAVGLLHDVGRFSQYAEFGTFSDKLSVNHGERGAAVLEQEAWTACWAEEDRTAMMESVRHHNARTIPAYVHGRALNFLRLIRDADKLDIYRIVLGKLDHDGFQELPAMLPQITLSRRLSADVEEEFARDGCVSFERLRTLADFLLMQLAWVNDFNFPVTHRLFHSRGFLNGMLRHMEPSVERQDWMERFAGVAVSQGG